MNCNILPMVMGKTEDIVESIVSLMCFVCL